MYQHVFGRYDSIKLTGISMCLADMTALDWQVSACVWQVWQH